MLGSDPAKRLWALSSEAVRYDIDCMSGLGWLGDYQPDFPFDMDLNDFKTAEFHNMVTRWMVLHRNGSQIYQETIAAGDEILGLIEAELKQRK